MINTDKLLKIAKREPVTFETDFLEERMSYNEFSDFDELISWLESNDDAHEYADGRVDIYNYDLRKWAVENYTYIEEAIDELGAPEPFDFHKAIQYGQYHKECQDIWSDCHSFQEFIEEKYLS